MSRVAIIGGHGKVALHLARILTDQGHEVSALIRNPDQADDVRKAGATPVIADIQSLSTKEIAAKLKGHDVVVWSAGAGGGSPERTYAIDRDAAIRSMNAAEEAGVTRYVMVSYMGSGRAHGIPVGDSMFPYAEAKAAADDYLRQTTLSWTILGPSRLTLEAGSGRIETGPGLSKKSVSREDVARVVAVVLNRPETAGKFIEFNNGDTPIEDAVTLAH